MSANLDVGLVVLLAVASDFGTLPRKVDRYSVKNVWMFIDIKVGAVHGNAGYEITPANLAIWHGPAPSDLD